MTRRRVAALLPWLLLTTGCLEESTRSQFISPMALPPTPAAAPERYVSQTPATEAVGKRVLGISQKLVLSNPQMGMRPVVMTVGAPHPEIFHRGGGAEGYQIFITEGLVKLCKNDDELAALLAMELGKMVSEREALAPPSARGTEERPPPRESIGSDVTGTFGPPDGTLQMEEAKLARQRHRAGAPSVPPPPPEVLARKYLQQAGFETGALTDIAGLLRQAEDHYSLERPMKSPPGR
ncbi:MAG: M48 family metalloprotease [Gemmataceae bacterium]